MIEINLNNWKDICQYLIENQSQASKKSKEIVFEDVFITEIKPEKNPFQICCYTNPKGKITALEKQYFNEESWKHLWDSSEVLISMVGGPKWGSNSSGKHCIEILAIDHNKKQVLVYFRNSDFFKKFLIDLYFIKNLLEERNLGDYQISYYFDNLTLRAPFLYIYLNQLTKEECKIYLDSEDNLKNLFLDYYKNQKDKEINWKSLERAFRRMKELKVYEIIKEYL